MEVIAKLKQGCHFWNTRYTVPFCVLQVRSVLYVR